jgi:hypothetical protein
MEDLRDDDYRPSKPTRQERLEYWADRGYDTWDEYEGRV